jgi:hypothetical protein
LEGFYKCLLKWIPKATRQDEPTTSTTTPAAPPKVFSATSGAASGKWTWTRTWECNESRRGEEEVEEDEGEEELSQPDEEAQSIEVTGEACGG